MQMRVAVLAGSWVCTEKLSNINPDILEGGREDDVITQFRSEMPDILENMKTTADGRDQLHASVENIRRHLGEETQDQDTADDLVIILLSTNHMPYIHGGCLPMHRGTLAGGIART